MAISYNPSIVRSGLVLCLDAGNTKSYPGSGTTWTDLSGNGNNGTLTNGPVFNSGNGGNIIFDGVNDYVQINQNSSLQISDGVTATVVVKVTGFGANRARLIDTTRAASPPEPGSMIALKIGTSSPHQDVSWFIVDNTYSYKEVRRSTAVITSTTTPYVITARWRKSDGSASIFVNGVETSYASSVTFTGTVGTLTNPIMIGFLQGYNIYGNQIIYLTQLYNRYLSDAEIQQNFNATRSRFGI